MSRRWRLVLALILVLSLPGAHAVGSENKVCEGEDNKVSVRPRCKPDPDAIAAWIEQNQIRSLAPTHWAAGPIMELALMGGLAVRPGAEIRPDGPATLWQAARAAMAGAGQAADFMTDRAVAERAAELNLIPGPVPPEDRAITRLEAAHVAARLTDFPGTVKQEADMARVFADWPAIAPQSQDLVYWVTIHHRLFVGFPDRTFRPGEGLTLGQFAVVVARLQEIRSSGPPPAVHKL